MVRSQAGYGHGMDKVWAGYGHGSGRVWAAVAEVPSRGRVVAGQGLQNYLTTHKHINNTNN
jgi:hypothetical protein